MRPEVPIKWGTTRLNGRSHITEKPRLREWCKSATCLLIDSYMRRELRLSNMTPKPNRSKPRVCMNYVSYGPAHQRGDDECARRKKDLEYALRELGFVTARLCEVRDRLLNIGENDLTEETVSQFVQELSYHGEFFLNTAYEIRDRLAALLAVLTECDKDDLIGRRAYEDKRMPRYMALKNSMPEVARQFLALESCICSFVKLRNAKTHEASLHFEFLLDGHPYDPEEILKGVKDDVSFGELVQLIRSEVNRFISRHVKACEEIEKAADALNESLWERLGSSDKNASPYN
jgi:hypothetical protein